MLGYDLDKEIKTKMQINEDREYVVEN